MPQKIEQSKQIAVTLNIAKGKSERPVVPFIPGPAIFLSFFNKFPKKTLINIVLININRKLLKILQITKRCK